MIIGKARKLWLHIFWEAFEIATDNEVVGIPEGQLLDLWIVYLDVLQEYALLEIIGKIFTRSIFFSPFLSAASQADIFPQRTDCIHFVGVNFFVELNRLNR